MSYDYEKCKKQVFTEEGTRKLMAIHDNIKMICAGSGAVTIEKALSTVSGDTFTMLACIDYLVELGKIQVVERPNYTYQKNIIVCENQ